MNQSTEKWHEWRKKGIGSSDAPIIMNVSPYMSPYQLWEQKLGLKESESGGFIQDLGHKFEPQARAHLKLEMDIDFKPDCIEHSEFEWVKASMDGICFEKRVFTEIKMVGEKNFDLILETDKPLEHHYPQVMHQYLVTGYEKGYYTFYTLNSDKSEIARIKTIFVPRNDNYIKEKLFPAEQDFWKKIQTQTPPDLTENDIKVLKDKNSLEIANDYIIKKQAFDKAKEDFDEAKKRVVSLCKDSKSQIECGNIRVSRVTRKGTVDYKKIPELKNIDLDKYRKAPSVYEKIKIIENE